MPYDLYSRFKAGEVKSDFLKTDKIDENVFRLLKKKEFIFSNLDTEKLWMPISVGHFNMTLPKNHPSIEFAPKPIAFRKINYPNFSLRDTNGKNILHLNFIDRRPLNLSLPPDKIFRTALVKKYIRDKSDLQIIHDVFTKNLDVHNYTISNPLKLLNSWSQVSPNELAYNIFIYKKRKLIFEDNILELYFVKNNMVLYKIDKTNSNTDGEYNFYILNIFKNGFINRLEISLRKDMPMSNLAFTRIVKSIEYDPLIDSNESLKYYTFFKSLPYSERLSNLGLLYLYAAWSLDIKNMNFIREMIQFFERNNANQSILNPVYEFARQVTGSNFSRKDSLLDEDAQTRLKRGVEAEKKKEEMELGNFEMEDIENLSKSEKIKYLLKKGKKHKNSDAKTIIED